jgi:hypothetical protein
MLHELQSKDFDKDNALAMLNTLFPPGMQELPNARIQLVENVRKPAL